MSKAEKESDVILMYTIQWCNEEGILQEREFERLEDAALEAMSLKEKYDGVQIVHENGSSITL